MSKNFELYKQTALEIWNEDGYICFYIYINDLHRSKDITTDEWHEIFTYCRQQRDSRALIGG